MKKILLVLFAVLFLSSFASATSLTNGIVSYWKFDESSGSIAIDSLSKNNLTINGITINQTGKINKGYFFNSGNTNANISSLIGTSNTNNFSFSFWINPNATSATYGLLGQRSGTGTFGTYIRNNGRIAITVQGDSDRQSDNSVITASTWQHITFVIKNGNTINVYKNGASVWNVTTGVATQLNTAIGLGVGSGQVGAGDTYFGFMDEVAIWNRSLSQAEIITLYNSGVGVQYPFGANASITARDLNTNNLIPDFNVTLVANETLTYNNVNGTTEVNILVNDTRLWNITIDAQDYFQYNLTNYNFSLNGSLTALLFSGSIAFGAFEKVTNQAITPFNITIGATTQNNSVPFILSIGTYNATFSKAGYQNKTEQFTVMLGTSSYNFTNVSNNRHNITLRYQNGSAVTYGAYNITVTNVANSFTETLSGNGSISNSTVFNLTQGLVYNITVNAAGFKTQSVLTNNLTSATTAQNITLMQSGFTNLSVLVYNEGTSALMSGSTTMTIDRYSSTAAYNINNGNATFLVPELNTSLRFVFNKTDFTTRQIIESFSGRLDYYNISIYLLNSSAPNVQQITFRVTDAAQNNLVNAFIAIKQVTPGGTITYEEKNTDIAGLANFNLDTTKTYTISIAKTGYVTQEFFIDFSTNEYLIVLSLDRQIDFTAGYGGISYIRSPTESILNASQTNFTLNITATGGNLDSVTVRVYDASNVFNVLGSQTYTNVGYGANITLPIDLTAYDNKSVVFRISYNVVGKEPMSDTRTYQVRIVENLTGSLWELREYVSNFPIFARITLFIFLLMINMTIMAVFVRGAANVIITLILSFMIGYMLAINLVFLGFAYLGVALVLYSNNRGRESL